MRALLRPKYLYFLPYNLRRGLYASLKHSKFNRLQYKRRVETEDGYTYKPYDDFQCIFVHIPKTAGMSICQSLFGNLAGGHATLADYQIIFAKHEFDNYFKFSFVRNPWDRVYSAYNFLKKGGATDFDRQWAMPMLSYLITSVNNGKAAGSRAWILKEDRSGFTEETISIIDGIKT